MFSDEELRLAFAVVAAAALMKGDAPGLTRVLSGRPAGAGPDGDAAGTIRPMAALGDEDGGHRPAAGAGLPGPAPAAPAWPTGAVPAWPTAATPILAAARRARGEGAQTRLLFAVDIAGFTDAGRDDEVQLVLRRALYQLLAEAFEASGISWADCVHEDRGDGVVVVVPQGLPAAILVDPLLYQLRVALRRHNRMASDVARIALRVAVHMGQMHRDEYGLAGTAVNHLFRLLDAPVLRSALAARGAELALIVSDHYYECVVRQRPSMIESAAFRPAAIKVKQTREHGWIWTPPAAVDAGRAVALRWWMTPVGAVCTMLWAGSAMVIATPGAADPSLSAGLALGAVAITGLVMAVLTATLAFQAAARSTSPARSVRTARPTRRTARISGTEPPGTGYGGRGPERDGVDAASAAGGVLSGG